jgi:hypothetical protein
MFRSLIVLFNVTYLICVTHLKLMDLSSEKFPEDNLKEYKVMMVNFVDSQWFYLLYLPILTFVLMTAIGRYALSGILYPYQNAFARESLDRGNATKFGEEFAHYLDSFMYTLRIQAGQDIRRTILMSLASDKKKSKVNEGSLADQDFPYDYLSFAEMRNVVDLLVLYIGVNQKVIDMGNSSKKFHKFHNNMIDLRETLKLIKIDPWE